MTDLATKRSPKIAIKQSAPSKSTGSTNKGSGSAAPSAIEITMERAAFFESGIKSLKRLAIGLGFVAAIATGVTYVAVNKKTAPVYFVAYEDGRLVTMIPLVQPNNSQAAVAQWLTHALADTFDFHFGNIEKELNEAASLWFTSAGADALMKTWEESGNYEAIVSRKLFVSLAVTNTPVLLKQGLPPGGTSYVWRYQAPAVLTFRTETRVFSNNVVFTVDVSRRSTLEDPKGLGISKIVMQVEP